MERAVAHYKGDGQGCLDCSSSSTSPRGEWASCLPSSPFTPSSVLGNANQIEAGSLWKLHYFSLPGTAFPPLAIWLWVFVTSHFPLL